MKKKSTFSQIIIIAIVAVVGIVLTLLIALLAGSSNAQLFDLSNLNLRNVIPVIIIGGFITCISVGFVTLFASRNIFTKIRNYFLEDNKDGGKKE